MSLGYGNFVNVIQYDTYAMAEAFIAAGNKWDLSKFSASDYGLDFSKYEAKQIINSPNLSLFPLLAYHKICNDHYRNEKWQPLEPWTCNIDYLQPQQNMNASSFISIDTFTTLMTSIIDLENSNLPLDYFTSVLPRAQYGNESAVSIGMTNKDVNLSLSDASNPTIGAYFHSQAHTLNDNLQKQHVDPAKYGDNWIFPLRTDSTGSVLAGLHGKMSSSDASLKISALRSATALQKYREIQNSNDPDFATQVLAHFGIKPKVDSRTSIFIGGNDKTLSINPQVNTNFLDGGQPDIKAIGVGDLSAGCKFTVPTNEPSSSISISTTLPNGCFVLSCDHKNTGLFLKSSSIAPFGLTISFDLSVVFVVKTKSIVLFSSSKLVTSKLYL